MSPNPNVLVELGYAASELGWGRVLLVQNSAYGRPEDLPFDLRGRRIVTYHLEENGAKKSETRGLLQGRLEGELRTTLQDSISSRLPSGANSQLWWGEWVGGDSDDLSGGHLFVRDICTDGFLFDLDVVNGAHIGSITAYARFASRDAAYAIIEDGNPEGAGELLIRRSYQGSRRTVTIEETKSCQRYRGVSVEFSGVFSKSSEPWFDVGFLNEIDIKRIYQVTGKYYRKIAKYSQVLSEQNDLDGLDCRVVTAGATGMFSIYESIVMIGEKGEIWVAFLELGKIRYFTNQPASKAKIPKTIQTWANQAGISDIKRVISV